MGFIWWERVFQDVLTTRIPTIMPIVSELCVLDEESSETFK